jgi:hypothetical protein
MSSSYSSALEKVAVQRQALTDAQTELAVAAKPEIQRLLIQMRLSLDEVHAIVISVPQFPSLDRAEVRRSLAKDLESMLRDMSDMIERTKKL